jgi:hypothetical protein
MDEMFSDAVSGYAEHGSRVERAGQRPIGEHGMMESARRRAKLPAFPRRYLAHARLLQGQA